MSEHMHKHHSLSVAGNSTAALRDLRHVTPWGLDPFPQQKSHALPDTVVTQGCP